MTNVERQEYAKRAYFSYCRRADYRSPNYIYVAWENLSATKRSCWEAAAVAVVDYHKNKVDL